MLLNIDGTIKENMSTDQIGQEDYFNKLYSEVFRTNGVILYVQDRNTKKMREAKTEGEIAESLTRIMEKINADKKEGKKNKEIISNVLGVAGFVPDPYISVGSGVASMILGNVFRQNRTSYFNIKRNC